MCRHIGYIGTPRPLGEFLFDAPHALARQGCAPREMVVAKDNPDGWGVAWWTSPRLEPLHYRTTSRMWDDRDFRYATDTTTAALAAVRKASPATTLRPENNAPFVATTANGPVAFSLNGHVFHESCAGRVRAALPPGATLVGDTDSEVLFAITQDRIAAGMDPAAALAAVHHVIAPGAEVFVNLLLVTPTAIAATTWHHTLYVKHADESITVASEALDADPAWRRVPDASLLVADSTGVTVTPLEGFR